MQIINLQIPAKQIATILDLILNTQEVTNTL